MSCQNVGPINSSSYSKRLFVSASPPHHILGELTKQFGISSRGCRGLIFRMNNEEQSDSHDKKSLLLKNFIRLVKSVDFIVFLLIYRLLTFSSLCAYRLPCTGSFLSSCVRRQISEMFRLEVACSPRSCLVLVRVKRTRQDKPYQSNSVYPEYTLKTRQSIVHGCPKWAPRSKFGPPKVILSWLQKPRGV